MGDELRAEAPVSGRRGVIPFGLVGMLALVAFVEARVARVGPEMSPLVVNDWRGAGEASRSLAVGSDLLLFGDSLVKTGVIPAVVEERLGLSTYNLAMLGAPPAGSYYLLRRAIDAGARPRAIVVGATASILMSSDLRLFHRQWSELLEPGELIEFARVEADPALSGMLVLDQVLPSFLHREDIRTSMRAKLVRKAPAPFPWGALQARQDAANRGAFVLEANKPGRPDPLPDGALGPTERMIFYPEMWWARPSNLIYLKKFLELAGRERVPVFFLIPPYHPAMQAGRERRGLDEPYIARIRDIRNAFPNVTVVDARHSGFGQEVFRDAIHLDRPGASALSQGLASVIRRGLRGEIGADRWVALPNFEPAATSARIEDEVESRQALAGEGRVVR